MVLDSSGQEAQGFTNFKKFFKRTEIFKISKILGFLARGTFLNF